MVHARGAGIYGEFTPYDNWLAEATANVMAADGAVTNDHGVLAAPSVKYQAACPDCALVRHPVTQWRRRPGRMVVDTAKGRRQSLEQREHPGARPEMLPLRVKVSDEIRYCSATHSAMHNAWHAVHLLGDRERVS